MIRPAMTMNLTRKPDLKAKAESWLHFTNDFSLGCHPLNLVFTVGLGQRYVHTAFNLFQLNSPSGLIPGLQTEGPSSGGPAGQRPKGGMGGWPAMSMYPPGRWPELYRYSENASPGMNEGTTQRQAPTTFAYGLLLPPAK